MIVYKIYEVIVYNFIWLSTYVYPAYTPDQCCGQARPSRGWFPRACPYMRIYSISTVSCRGNCLWLPVFVDYLDQHGPQKGCGLIDKNVNYPLKQSVNNYCLDTGLFVTSLGDYMGNSWRL